MTDHQILERFRQICKEWDSVLVELTQAAAQGSDISPRFSNSMAQVLQFLRDHSREEPRLRGQMHFRLAVTARHNALRVIWFAIRKGLEIPFEDLHEIIAFPESFNFKIGRRSDWEFHFDWFSRNLQCWTEDLAPLMRRKKNRILEVGCMEGFSTCWLIEKFLRDSGGSITCVDIFGYLPTFRTFKANIDRTGKRNQVTIKKGDSRKILRKLPLDSYDFIYLDGSHVPGDVLEDLALSWGLLKTGGILIIDDYLMPAPAGEASVKEVVDLFVSSHMTGLDVIRTNHQITIRRLPVPEPGWIQDKSVCPEVSLAEVCEKSRGSLSRPASVVGHPTPRA